MPCASQVQIYDGKKLGGDEYCNWNQTEVDSHLAENEYKMFVFYNERVFN